MCGGAGAKIVTVAGGHCPLSLLLCGDLLQVEGIYMHRLFALPLVKWNLWALVYIFVRCSLGSCMHCSVCAGAPGQQRRG